MIPFLVTSRHSRVVLDCSNPEEKQKDASDDGCDDRCACNGLVCGTARIDAKKRRQQRSQRFAGNTCLGQNCDNIGKQRLTDARCAKLLQAGQELLQRDWQQCVKHAWGRKVLLRKQGSELLLLVICAERKRLVPLAQMYGNEGNSSLALARSPENCT